MKRSGLIPSDEQHDAVLNIYATCGLVEEADAFFRRLSIDMTRDRQRDLVVKARVKAKRLDDACALIHSLEKQLTPAPMRSYTRVIRALFSQRAPGSEQYKALAWDMFSHMRYVAHGTPDEFLYTVMMRACAESADPEPERALDLFKEMTVDKNIIPTTYTYNAVILTCARSKKFALEAFRLAREMLNSHRDAHGEIPTRLRPDNATFCALLEAAKRTGDLPRARWILAQMISDAPNLREGERPVYIDERVMTHVFHAYASYRPPFRRNAVPYVPGGGAGDPGDPGSEIRIGASENQVNVADLSNRQGVPQSHQEIVKEATILWERMLENRAADSPSDVSPHHLVFGRVSLTTTLLNAYMAVHYIHSPPSAAYKVYENLFGSLGFRRDAFTYVLALEAYAQGKRASKEELRVALSVARDIWKRWRQLEDLGVSQMSNHSSSEGVDARMVERAWSAMMRLLTINDRLDEAVDLIYQFVDRYPPQIVKHPSPPDPRQSTRTSLYAERPIVRLTDRSTIPEDRIPPFLTFRDLNTLHHRAIAAKRPDYITYITWVARAYEGALRRRREGTLRPVIKCHDNS
ncbi:hypothetical protein JB92DRAFT_2814976 [Gautieria morchelliformis]|nr:hypothetical protein JB92DRAFT_2814976 [Gautieria morchelliformis]